MDFYYSNSNPTVFASTAPPKTFYGFNVGKLLISFSQDIQNLQNGRKRPVEVNHDQIALNGTTALNEWKKNKRKKLSSFEQNQSHQITEELTEIKDCRVWNLQYLMRINNNLL